MSLITSPRTSNPSYWSSIPGSRGRPTPGAGSGEPGVGPVGADEASGRRGRDADTADDLAGLDLEEAAWTLVVQLQEQMLSR